MRAQINRMLKLLTAGDVARVSGVSPNTVSKWCDSQKLPFSQTPGGHRRFRVADVVAFCRRYHLPCWLDNLDRPTAVQVIVASQDQQLHEALGSLPWCSVRPTSCCMEAGFLVASRLAADHLILDRRLIAREEAVATAAFLRSQLPDVKVMMLLGEDHPDEHYPESVPTLAHPFCADRLAEALLGP